jgi:hypothetical protein
MTPFGKMAAVVTDLYDYCLDHSEVDFNSRYYSILSHHGWTHEEYAKATLDDLNASLSDPISHPGTRSLVTHDSGEEPSE